MINKHKIRAGMLLVRPTEKADKMVGLIIVPDTAISEPNNGTVVLAGKCLLSDPHEIGVGDRVYYGEKAGHEITLYDVKYRLIQSKEVLTYIEKEEIN